MVVGIFSALLLVSVKMTSDCKLFCFQWSFPTLSNRVEGREKMKLGSA